MRDVSVIGVSETQFGRLDKSFRELIAEAGNNAIKDSKAEKEEIESLYLGSYSPDRFIQQGHSAPLASLTTGLDFVPTTRTENACSSSAAAFKEAYLGVASGAYDLAIAIGAEKMTEVSTGEATEILAMAGDRQHEGVQGITFPGLFALMAQAYRRDYNIDIDDFRDQLSSVAIKNHRNASHNKYAHMNSEMSMEEANESRMIAYPLQLADCSLISDGAAAAVLAPSEKAENYVDEPIDISGFGHTTDILPVHLRDELSKSVATEKAAEKAYNRAGVKPEDVDFAEVHDCFTINELITLEGLGFFENGKAGKASLEGETRVDGKIPVNLSGGLKAKGHPVGATGVGQIAEAVMQLRGEVEDERQAENPEIGLCHNIGGAAVSCFIHILSRR